MVTSREGLLAWTGHTLQITPTINRRMSLAHWGNSQLTGRGLVALSGAGQIYKLDLKAGEEYVAYPGNVLAYTVTQNPPLPYRFKSSALRFQIPNIGISALLQRVKFFRVMSESTTWLNLKKALFLLRTSFRRTIWGDRLFLQFKGPTTLLISSRATRINDVLSSRDVDEIADAPAGEVHKAVTLLTTPNQAEVAPRRADKPTGFSVASVGTDGKVSFAEPKSLEGFTR